MKICTITNKRVYLNLRNDKGGIYMKKKVLSINTDTIAAHILAKSSARAKTYYASFPDITLNRIVRNREAYYKTDAAVESLANLIFDNGKSQFEHAVLSGKEISTISKDAAIRAFEEYLIKQPENTTREVFKNMFSTLRSNFEESDTDEVINIVICRVRCHINAHLPDMLRAVFKDRFPVIFARVFSKRLTDMCLRPTKRRRV
jgi:hypothetical protein